jgi:hypothetical protein
MALVRGALWLGLAALFVLAVLLALAATLVAAGTWALLRALVPVAPPGRP